MVNPGSPYENSGSARLPDAVYQVSEEMVKQCGRRQTTEAYLSYKLTSEASAQVS